MKNFVIGLDFGTDSVRGILVDEETGEELCSSVCGYRRWQKGLYSDAIRNQFRQHPLDYIEGLEVVIKELLSIYPSAAPYVRAIGLDTTGSTVCLVDRSGQPLSLDSRYKDDPDAMFMLWKDHTSLQEADEINELIAGWPVDYSRFSGGNYSSEWLWAKALHALRSNPALRESAYSVVEHCDWIPALLTGVKRSEDIVVARCSAGHKAMWSEAWGGFPSPDFLSQLDPQLGLFVTRMQSETLTCDQAAGSLSQEWSERLGLSQDVLVGVGNTDAHAGAVGAGIQYNTLVQNMGTSTCSMVVMPPEVVGDNAVEGISGQVDGSIIPGMIGFEAGMSAFGDVYAWFKRLITSDTAALIRETSLLSNEQKDKLIQELSDKMLIRLTEEAVYKITAGQTVHATDWLNGRRNPFLNYDLKATITGLTLSSSAADIYASLVEATVFGIKSIVDHFRSNQVAVEEIVAIGGVPLKSPFVMQLLCDALGMPIRVPDSSQACALGAAMFAATVSGRYKDVREAQSQFARPDLISYCPDEERTRLLTARYEMYQNLKVATERNFAQ